MTSGADGSRHRPWRTILFGLVIAAIVGGFVIQMAHGICPVP